MRVAMVTNYYPPNIQGGAEVYVQQLVRGLRAAGHDVTVITNCPGTSFDEPGVANIDRAANPVLLGLLVPDRSIDRALKTILKRIRPDVVHVHNTHSTLGFGTYAVCGKWPTLVTIHDYQLFCLIGVNYRERGNACDDRRFCSSCAQRFYPKEASALGLTGWKNIAAGAIGRVEILARILVWLRNARRAEAFATHVARVLCVSEAVATTMARWHIPAEKIVVFPNGIADPPSEERPPETSAMLRIGYIGRLTDAKGVDVLLGALQRLAASGIAFEARIAGSGPAAKALANAAATQIPDGVFFLGHLDRDEVEAFYASVDMIVVPSVWPDPLPVVIAEALGRGKIVVGSRIGGISDMLDGEGGVTFESGRDDDLARVLSKLVDPQLRATIAAAARTRFAERYRLADHVRLIERIYSDAAFRR